MSASVGAVVQKRLLAVRMSLPYLIHKKPACIIVAGRPGAGKTTLARLLGDRLRMPVISRDVLKEGYVNTFGCTHDQLPSDANQRVAHLFFAIVNHYLTGMISVVIEAAFQHHVWAPQMPLIRQAGDPIMIVCTVDPTVAAQRHLERGLNDPDRLRYHGDRRVAIYRESGVLAPPEEYVAPAFDIPTIHVATQEGYTPGIEEIVAQIRSVRAHMNLKNQVQAGE